MPAALEIDWAEAKIEFIRLRSGGKNYTQAVEILAEKYGSSESTVQYHSRKGRWVDTFNAASEQVTVKLKKSMEVAADCIAEGVGGQMLDLLSEFKLNPAIKPADLLTKAQALKTLSEVRSRYNPDGQEKAGGVSLFQVNVGSDMRQAVEKPVIEVQSEQVKTPE